MQCVLFAGMAGDKMEAVVHSAEAGGNKPMTVRSNNSNQNPNPTSSQNRTPPTSEEQILIYKDGGLDLPVRLDGETLWLTQAGMAKLFRTTKQNISLHFQKIFGKMELDPSVTVRKYSIVKTEGLRQVRRRIDHYNLEAILAVGMRVKSARAVAFREWAIASLAGRSRQEVTTDNPNPVYRSDNASGNALDNPLDNTPGKAPERSPDKASNHIQGI